MLLKIYIVEEKQQHKQMEVNEPWRSIEMKKDAKPRVGLRGFRISWSAEVSKAENQNDAADEDKIRNVELANADRRKSQGRK